MLTSRQKAFVNFYLADPNGTRAATLAGFKHPRQAAARLLTNDNVSRELATASALARHDAAIDRERAMQILSAIAENGCNIERVAAITTLGKMESWFGPSKIAPTDPSGENPYSECTREEMLDLCKRMIEQNDPAAVPGEDAGVDLENAAPA